MFSTHQYRVKVKLRRVFILSSGWNFNADETINLIKQNSSTTMCNTFEIGYAIDNMLLKGIEEIGNGLSDFVLSGEDLRMKVINQLYQSLNGFSKFDISFDNNINFELIPSEHKLLPNEPATFFFKSSNDFPEKSHIRIDIEGNSKPIIIQPNYFDPNSAANKSFQYMFNNVNLKLLRKMEQTNEIK